MQFEQIINILNETGLSPETLAGRLCVSNLTYRRWLKRPPHEQIPKSYERNIIGGIHQLLAEGLLNRNSERLEQLLAQNVPEFFHAAVSQFNLAEQLINKDASQEDQITSVLAQIGNKASVQRRIDGQLETIKSFIAFGNEWKDRITLLLKTLRAKNHSLVDKCIAYGALFYLILPLDLIPDSIPVFGYVDDFGILGFAATYYGTKKTKTT